MTAPATRPTAVCPSVQGPADPAGSGRPRQVVVRHFGWVLQPSVLRGRTFKVAATAARSSALYRARSVPFGGYWRSSLLMLS